LEQCLEVNTTNRDLVVTRYTHHWLQLG